MIITRETDYALRILRALSNCERSTVGEISERESVPQQFAYKILKKLKKAGFVNVARGADGGCSIAVDLNETSLYDLIEAIENNSQMSSCLKPGYKCEWREKNKGICIVHSQLSKIQKAIDKELCSRSISWILSGEE